ncbi:DinB family protein [Ilyomonas limi]|uniref:DinB family protein n=1 Tax=Ilyomonas limi TaxID=2575867 RepID=A0A4U3L0I8_9BACT|nr:DinB family protein [Ilyomonas limi]TKK67709.1 DinB family protein [Ilyomonas limi]
MQIIPLLLKELDSEAAITRKMLSRIPDDKYDWKPHEKSMSIRQLAAHIAEIPGWITLALNTNELDFAKGDYKPANVNNTQELLGVLDQSVASAKSALENAKEEDLLPDWTMRNGDQVYMVLSKYEVIRHAFAQLIHHRAQMGVFLRLLNVPIPGTYGPSADEMAF